MGINQPPGYIHPRKRGKGKSVQPAGAASAIDIERPDKKKKGSFATQPVSPTIKKKATANESMECEKVVLRLAAHPPIEGQIKLFDEMRESGLSDKEATLALLRQGTKKLDEVSRMSAPDLKVIAYDNAGGVIETNRKVSVKLLNDLKTSVDPFGALTTRALAIKIGEAVLVLTAKEKNTG